MDLTEGIGHHDIMQNRRIFINQNKKNPDIARRNRFNRSEMTRGTAPDGFPMGPSAWSSHGLPIGFAAKTHVRGLLFIYYIYIYIYIITVDICGNYKKLDLTLGTVPGNCSEMMKIANNS